ncbi:MAG: bifunctional folylpolyglutamate synthase/dihydrofolate synthase [Clostridium sp.]|nr:bifunctional folylpolyglutamate synthase/dihydrofolate synthase [Clostridium sp.]
MSEEQLSERYRETTEFLFSQIPAFHNVGSGAYKPGLERVCELDKMYGSPSRAFPTIHIAGTNGKGSVSSTLAAILQSAGYRTGLFTSPHLVDFRERIRVNGEMISRREVVEFSDRFRRENNGATEPSFFELTTVMAFDHFRRQKVDVAAIEVGLGGRLDSTNIVSPELSVITNISPDHTALLGDTPEAIAVEKAGIIKPGVPVVVGESDGGVRDVFSATALQNESPIVYADDLRLIRRAVDDGGGILYQTDGFGTIRGQLRGECQVCNASTILAAVVELRRIGFDIPDRAVAEGFEKVCELTGLRGRWESRCVDGVEVICDTGHNVGGWTHTVANLNRDERKKILVVGFVNDKDVSSIMNLISQIDNRRVIFTQASVARALPAEELRQTAAFHGVCGEAVADVGDAVAEAVRLASADPEGSVVFVGGSTFVVADWLSSLSEQR